MEDNVASNSYHQDLEKGKKPEIAMPPLPEEEAPEPVEQEDTVVEPAQEEYVAPKPNNQENLRLLREKAKSAERLQIERDELLRRMQEMEQQRAPKQAAPVEEDDDDFSMNPDDLVEGKHLAKITSKYKKLEAQLKSYQKQSSESVIETRLKNEYPDFDKVVSRENIDELRTLYPHLAATLHSSADLYNKGASAYTLIKQLGIHQVDNHASDRQRAIVNSAKPRPLTSVSPQQGDSPLSHANAFANGLTDDLKRQLQKEMADAIKQR